MKKKTNSATCGLFYLGVYLLEHYLQLGFMIIDAILTIAVGWAGLKLNQYSQIEEKREVQENARNKLQIEVARLTIIRECNHYITKGYAPLYAVDSISEMYQAYHELGGNGAVTGIYNEFLSLPHNPREN